MNTQDFLKWIDENLDKCTCGQDLHDFGIRLYDKRSMLKAILKSMESETLHKDC